MTWIICPMCGSIRFSPIENSSAICYFCGTVAKGENIGGKECIRKIAELSYEMIKDDRAKIILYRLRMQTEKFNASGCRFTNHCETCEQDKYYCPHCALKIKAPEYSFTCYHNATEELIKCRKFIRNRKTFFDEDLYNALGLPIEMNSYKAEELERMVQERVHAYILEKDPDAFKY